MFLITAASGDVLIDGGVPGEAPLIEANIRKLGVAGEDLPRVQYQLDDPDEYQDEDIVVIGTGDAGIENALVLAREW